MSDNENGAPLVCGVRTMQAPDGRDIPVPSGEVGLPNGSVFVRPDAEVQIAIIGNGFNVVVNNGDPSSSSESSQLFEELAGEVGETAFEAALEHAFQAVIPAAIEAVGFVGGLLASILTTTHLTREVFIQAELPEDGTPVKYCLLVSP